MDREFLVVLFSQISFDNLSHFWWQNSVQYCMHWQLFLHLCLRHVIFVKYFARVLVDANVYERVIFCAFHFSALFCHIQDPCTDLRHQRIWNETAVYCKPNEISRITRLPDVLVIGPQKSGSTALYTFMAMHPDLIRSRSTKHAYEEVQFFNRNEYKKGLRWQVYNVNLGRSMF